MMLSLDTAYRSFGGEVEASSTPTICRLPDSRRHQLSAIAPQPVRLGSKATEMACSCDVRFPLESDRLADLLGSCVDLVTVTKIAHSFFVCSQELKTSDCHPR